MISQLLSLLAIHPTFEVYLVNWKSLSQHHMMLVNPLSIHNYTVLHYMVGTKFRPYQNVTA